MSADAAFVHTWRVGRWTVTLTVPPIAPGFVRQAVAEWEPAMPGRPLTASEHAQYQAGLARAMQSAAQLAVAAKTDP
jgi:hypothetical protein